jgi:hypothetical protein
VRGDGAVLKVRIETADTVHCSKAIYNATMRGGTEEVQIDVAWPCTVPSPPLPRTAQCRLFTNKLEERILPDCDTAKSPPLRLGMSLLLTCIRKVKRGRGGEDVEAAKREHTEERE